MRLICAPLQSVVVVGTSDADVWEMGDGTEDRMKEQNWKRRRNDSRPTARAKTAPSEAWRTTKRAVAAADKLPGEVLGSFPHWATGAWARTTSLAGVFSASCQGYLTFAHEIAVGGQLM